MPYDITMCKGGDCIIKENCIRFTGIIYGRQDFFGSPPFDKISKKCEHYLDDRPKEELVRQYAYQLWQQQGCLGGNDLEFWYKAEQELITKYRNSL
jgi:hypothetical protein